MKCLLGESPYIGNIGFDEFEQIHGFSADNYALFEKFENVDPFALQDMIRNQLGLDFGHHFRCHDLVNELIRQVKIDC